MHLKTFRIIELEMSISKLCFQKFIYIRPCTCKLYGEASFEHTVLMLPDQLQDNFYLHVAFRVNFNGGRGNYIDH